MLTVKEDDLNNTYTYISREDEWYIAGTEAKLEANCGHAGLFVGRRISQQIGEGSHHPIGTEYEDGELCPWEEFDIYKAAPNLFEVKPKHTPINSVVSAIVSFA